MCLMNEIGMDIRQRHFHKSEDFHRLRSGINACGEYGKEWHTYRLQVPTS